MSEEIENPNRRQFIKTAGAAGAFTLVGGNLSAQVTASNQKIFGMNGYQFPQGVDTSIKEYHICQGLNMTGDKPGTSKKQKMKNSDELHSCMGGNSCKGLGACGTGEYNRQYWVADNLCSKEPTEKGQTEQNIPWNGTGGCGVPIGTGNTGYISSQLNSAAPGKVKSGKDKGKAYPSDFVGQSVWNIARARFELKMVKNNKAFGIPSNLKDSPDLHAAEWDGKSQYKPNEKSPPPYPLPCPPMNQPQPKLSDS